MSMPELSEAGAATLEPSTTKAAAQIAEANKHAVNFMFGAQILMLEEFVFAGNEILERALTEMHLFSEFISKVAGSHSVKDLKTMSEECAQHQIDFIRRDSERLFRHGERLLETTSKLLSSRP